MKRRPSTTLSLFPTSPDLFSIGNPKPNKAPRIFEDRGVGSGIDAAMANAIRNNNQESAKVSSLTVSTRSNRFGIDDSGSVFDESLGLFFTSSSPKLVTRELWIDDFLRACNLCRKLLRGEDIFMYRGEKWFCSVECRYKYIISDAYTGN